MILKGVLYITEWLTVTIYSNAIWAKAPVLTRDQERKRLIARYNKNRR